MTMTVETSIKALPPILALSSPQLPYQNWDSTATMESWAQQAFKQSLHSQNLLQFLIRIQQTYGWINEEAISWCADRFSDATQTISHEEIRGIIDFYSFLQRVPATPLHLYLSTNITDDMLGQRDNLAFFQQLAKEYPEKFAVSTTSCSGLCDQGPAGLLNGFPITSISTIKTTLAKLIKDEISHTEFLQSLSPVKDNIQIKEQLLNTKLAPGEGLKRVLTNSPADFLAELNSSQLRGRGGAGFPTALKWQTCQSTKALDKVIVCNADEGEPGTFKDRVLLHSHIEQVLEGMTIASYSVGASIGFIYLRFEYQYLAPLITQAIRGRLQNKLLGQNILGHDGFHFQIQIHLGAGAYVCGEETALLESLEGKRGIPRIRPPFPAQSGYLGLPTVVNNVETFCCVTAIALNGTQAFVQAACEGSTGTKIHSVSGDCDKPGIYELTFDCTVADLLNKAGAKLTQAVQVGGPSGKLLFPDSFDEKLNFSHVSSGGSFMVFNSSRDLFQVVQNFTHFFHHESCGFCTPCRVGCGILESTLDKFIRQQGSEDDIQHLEEMMALMDVASHCGLGQTASHPVRHLLANKRDQFVAKEKPALLKIDIAQHTSEARRLRLHNATMESHHDD